jgi:hypothetical protein
VPDRRIEELEAALSAHAAGMRPRPDQGWAQVQRRMRRHRRQRIATLATAAAAAVVLAVFVVGVLPGSDPAPRPVAPVVEPSTTAPAPTVTTTARPPETTARVTVDAPPGNQETTTSTRRPRSAPTTTTSRASATPDVYQVDPVPAGSGKETAMYGVGCPVGTPGQSLRVSLHHVGTGSSFVSDRTVIDGTGDDGRYQWRAFVRPPSDAPTGPYRLKVRCSAAGLYEIGGTFEGVAP